MNEAHLRICSSEEWAAYLEEDLAPWVLAPHDLGDQLLEIGPGPGLTTDLLRLSVPHLTALEMDLDLAGQLERRMSGSNVEVVCGDGAALPFPSGQFSAAVLLTMLHHVPSHQLQDRLVGEVLRTLRPGGIALGSDGLDTPERRELHQGDTFVPVDPAQWEQRLLDSGFASAEVEIRGDRFRFAASKAG
jgi:SAM-dependent methyltransferase